MSQCKTAVAFVIAGLLAWTGMPARGQNQRDNKAEVQLQAAIHTEMIDGNWKAAIEQYKRLVQGKDRAVAAKALVRMGECYEKLGDTEARKAFERVVREFGDQKEAVASAHARLAALGKVASGPNSRLIGKDAWVAGASPDGRFLLQYGANGEMDLRDLATGQTRQITKASSTQPAVSPYCRQIAFMRRGDKNSELRLVNVDGSGERLLWKSDEDWSAGIPQWFPDGKRVLVLAWDKVGGRRLTSVSAAGGEATRLWEGRMIYSTQLSPDGKNVVFVRRGRDEPVGDQIWLLRLDDKSETLLFEGQSYVNYPSWTPDGAGVVFLSDRRAPGATVDLWLLRTSGGKPLGFPELVKTDLGGMANGYPTTYAAGPITREGTYHFNRTTGGEMIQLLTTKFDPESGKVVGTPSFVSRKGGVSRAVSFSHDGRWLSYQSNTGPNKSWVIQSVESGEERVLPMTPSPVPLHAAWIFPDGRSFLVRAVHPRDGFGIYRVDAASGAWTLIKKPGTGEAPAQNEWITGISPDGRTAILNRGPGNHGPPLNRVVALNVETGQELELMKGSGISALSYDGQQLAVTRSDGKDCVIEVLPAAGGPRREVYRVSGFKGAEITWTPDGRYLIFGPFDKLTNVKAFMRVSVEGGEAEPIGISASQDGQVQFPRSFSAVRVHPNGRQLVYQAFGRGGGSEIWALENFLPKAAK